MRRRRTTAQISFFSFQDIITSVTGIMILVSLLMGLELSQRRLAAPGVHTAAVAADLQPAVDSAEAEIRLLERRLAARGDEMMQAAEIDANRLQQDLADLERQTRQMEQDARAAEAKLDSARRRRDRAQGKFDASRPQRDLAERMARQLADAQRRLERLRASNRFIYNGPPGGGKAPWLVEVAARRIAAAPVGKAERPTVFAAENEAEAIEAFCRWAKGRDHAAEYFLLIVKPDAIETFKALQDELTALGFEFGFDVAPAEQLVLDPEQGAGF